jgi:gliding motility-associated protein GldL
MKFLHSKKGKIVLNFLYGAGASVVIVGALFKILHWPGANTMLMIGLSTESLIFLISAFEPPHEDVDWSLVYPELAGLPGEGGHDSDRKGGNVNVQLKDSISQELDKLLEEAKIGPELIESLGDGLRKLGENTSKLADMTDAGVATDEYINNVKKASSTVSNLSDAYVKAADSLTGVGEADGKTYGEQLQRVSKNLSALNSVYELQIQGSQEFISASTKAYDNIAQLLTNLSDSVEDTKKYKQEIHVLGQNLSALNNVYGNMLAAMNVNPTRNA